MPGGSFCKCGRHWYADWYGKNEGYRRICEGCGWETRNCKCPPRIDVLAALHRERLT